MQLYGDDVEQTADGRPPSHMDRVEARELNAEYWIRSRGA